MLNAKGFDLWADGYDRSVQLSEASDEYPFAGYKDVLNAVYRAVHARAHASVLDLGFGTGVLTAKLYAEGYAVSGVDFSPRMIVALTTCPRSGCGTAVTAHSSTAGWVSSALSTSKGPMR